MSQRGFTLIEMAMVFVLVGLLVGGGLFALAPILDKTRFNQTNATLDQAETALLLFVARNKRLPCPADGSDTSGATTYGHEKMASATADTTGGTCFAAATTNGVIPWQTLGLDEGYSIDGWGNRLSYFASQPGVAGAGGASDVLTLNPKMNRTTTWPTGPFMTVTDVVSTKAVTPASTVGNVNQYDQAAYVLISHGKSGWYGWNRNGSMRQPSISDPHKACNNNPASCALAANSFASGGPVGTSPPTSGTYFDDIVRWRSAAFIIQLCGQGSCGNP